MWWVYLLECIDGTLYCGISNDVEARVAKHNAGKGAAYTRGRRPVRLVWSKEVGSKSAALKREHQIKQMGRAEKLKLCRRD